MKRFLVFLLCLTATVYADTDVCPFCNPEVIARQKYFENDLVIALYNYRPVIEGHCLIIPKRHVERFEELTAEEMVAIQAAINKTDQAVKKVFQTQDFFILQKNGKSAGQTVPHVHFHYIPSEQGENPYKILGRFIIYPFKSKLDDSEVKHIADQLEGASN